MGTVAVTWVASQSMTGADSYGHPLVIGSWPERDPEWSGLKPADLLLLSAAACSAYEVMMILSRQREMIDALEIACAGEQEPDPPYAFTRIHLHYIVKGPSLNPKKVERAIRLSQDKYCSVVNTLKPTVNISSDFEMVA